MVRIPEKIEICERIREGGRTSGFSQERRAGINSNPPFAPRPSPLSLFSSIFHRLGIYWTKYASLEIRSKGSIKGQLTLGPFDSRGKKKESARHKRDVSRGYGVSYDRYGPGYKPLPRGTDTRRLSFLDLVSAISVSLPLCLSSFSSGGVADNIAA